MCKIERGSEVELTVEKGRLVVAPVAPRFTLESLVGGITDKNRHAEVPLGRRRGQEAW